MKSLARIAWAVLLVILSCAVALNAQAPATQTPSNPNDPMELVRQGRRLNGEGKQEEALALFRRALELSPNLYDAHLAAGIALDLKGQYGEARKYLARAIELATPENQPQALRSMAMSYAFERKANEAAKYEKEVFDADVAKQDFPAAAEIANELARVYLESGDPDNAHQWYDTGHTTALRKPNISDAEKDLWEFRWEHAQARVAARRGRRDAAQKHVAAARAIFDKGTITQGGQTDQARFWPYLTGYVAFYSGDYKTAIAELRQADQRDPFILSLLAQAYEKSGDTGQALEFYRKVLASNAHNPTNAFARPLAKQKLAAAH